MEKHTEYYEATRTDVLPLVPDVPSYLDVGCASATFSGRIKDEHPDAVVYGIEPEPGAARRAAERLDRVIEGTVPECLPELGRRFDCIICNDVLEHIVDPWGALDALLEHLEDDGWIIVSLPNVRNLQTVFRLVVKGRWEHESSGVHDATHLRFFTRSTAEEMLTAAGLEVVEVAGSFPLGQSRFRFLHLERIPPVQRLLYRQYIFLARRRAPGAPGITAGATPAARETGP